MLFKNIELNGKMSQFCIDETSTMSENTRGVLSKLKKKITIIFCL